MDNGKTKKKGYRIIAQLCLITILCVAAYSWGFYSGKREEAMAMDGWQSFYAVVVDIREDETGGIVYLVASEIDFEEWTGSHKNMRFFITEKTRLMWRGEEISIDHFQPGDLIQAIFLPPIFDDYIPNVLDVYLLRDERR